MRVLLLGGTGNLGSRCIQALLAHGHILTVYVRNLDKLKFMFTPAVINNLEAIVIGDATDPEGIKRAIREHNIEAIIDVAGNQVLPWKEHLLPKIAKAVTEAAIGVGKERGEPLRAWVTTWPGNMKIESDHLLREYLAVDAMCAQHSETAEVVKAIPVSDLQWSLLCVCAMQDAPRKSKVLDVLEAPRHHDLIIQSTILPDWEWSWLSKLPYIGELFKRFEWLLIVIFQYDAFYEDVADFVAEDLEVGGQLRVGMEVGYKQKKGKFDS